MAEAVVVGRQSVTARNRARIHGQGGNQSPVDQEAQIRLRRTEQVLLSGTDVKSEFKWMGFLLFPHRPGIVVEESSDIDMQGVLLVGDEEAMLVEESESVSARRCIFETAADGPTLEFIGRCSGFTVSECTFRQYDRAGEPIVGSGQSFIECNGAWPSPLDRSLIERCRFEWSSPYHYGPCIALKEDNSSSGSPEPVVLVECRENIFVTGRGAECLDLGGDGWNPLDPAHPGDQFSLANFSMDYPYACTAFASDTGTQFFARALSIAGRGFWVELSTVEQRADGLTETRPQGVFPVTTGANGTFTFATTVRFPPGTIARLSLTDANGNTSEAGVPVAVVLPPTDGAMDYGDAPDSSFGELVAGTAH